MKLQMTNLKLSRIFTMIIMLSILQQSKAHDLKINNLNPKSGRTEQKEVSDLILSVSSYFPFIEKGNPLEIKLCGKGGPACRPENAFVIETNVINLEIFSSPVSNPIKINDFSITKTTLVHEYGHYIFNEYATLKNDKYKKLIAALKYIWEQERKMYAAISKNDTETVKKIEEEFNLQKDTILIARQMIYTSFFYQEVFADFLAAVIFQNPDVVCLAAEGSKLCTLEEVKVRKFSQLTSIEESKILMENNPQGAQHVGLSSVRNILWKKYLLLTEKGESQELLLNKVLSIFVAENEKALFSDETYNIKKMNNDLIEAINHL